MSQIYILVLLQDAWSSVVNRFRFRKAYWPRRWPRSGMISSLSWPEEFWGERCESEGQKASSFSTALHDLITICFNCLGRLQVASCKSLASRDCVGSPSRKTQLSSSRRVILFILPCPKSGWLQIFLLLRNHWATALLPTTRNLQSSCHSQTSSSTTPYSPMRQAT